MILTLVIISPGSMHMLHVILTGNVMFYDLTVFSLWVLFEKTVISLGKSRNLSSLECFKCWIIFTWFWSINLLPWGLSQTRKVPRGMWHSDKITTCVCLKVIIEVNTVDIIPVCQVQDICMYKCVCIGNNTSLGY